MVSSGRVTSEKVNWPDGGVGGVDGEGGLKFSASSFIDEMK